MAFVIEAADPDAVIWRLRVERAGDAVLFYGEEVASHLPGRESLAILKSEGNPAELAEEFMAELTSQLAIRMHEHARMNLEADLSRWIAEQF